MLQGQAGTEAHLGERGYRYERHRPEQTLLLHFEEQGMVYLAETDTHTAMSPLQSAACTYRIAFGPRAGQKVLSLQSIPSFDAQHTKQRCVNEQGFSLHAEVRCAMNQRNKLEQPCRYITRPAITNERLKLNSTGDVVLRLKSLYQDGTTHIVMSPLSSCNDWPLWSCVQGSILFAYMI